MTSMLFVGLIGTLLIIFFKSSIIDLIGENNQIVHKLRNTNWFQNHWLTGIFLFIINAILFFLTILVLYIFMQVLISYVHLVVMFLAVIASIFFWVLVSYAWRGTKKNRLKMGAIGSSFYLFLTLSLVYLLMTLQSSSPEHDSFMAAFGLMIGITVTAVASISCFVITGFAKKGN